MVDHSFEESLRTQFRAPAPDADPQRLVDPIMDRVSSADRQRRAVLGVFSGMGLAVAGAMLFEAVRLGLPLALRTPQLSMTLPTDLSSVSTLPGLIPLVAMVLIAAGGGAAWRLSRAL